MPRNIQSGWSAPTVIAVDPPSAIDDGTLDVTGGAGSFTLTISGVLAGGTLTNPGGTISLSVGAGLTDLGGGSIANGGVLQIGTLAGSISLGNGLSQSGGSLSNAGVLSIDGATGAMLIGAGLQRSSQTMSVKAATTAALGGIVAGANTTIDANGTLSVPAPGTATVREVIAGAGLTTSVTSANGTITGSGTLTALETPVAQTGTAYAFAASDRANLITFSNTAAIAATIAQAGTATFPAGWFVDVQNIGAGLLTITPTTSTIQGSAALQLMTGFGSRIISDGTNYLVQNSAALYALPSSAISNWLPSIPSATLGGNARGSNALDIQAVRNNATQVASGGASVAIGNYIAATGLGAVAFGYLSRATAPNATALGVTVDATGTNSLSAGIANTSSGAASITLGHGNTATASFGQAVGEAVTNFGTGAIGQGTSLTVSGNFTVMHGQLGDDRGNGGARIWSPISINSSSAKGHSQVEDYLFVNSTAGSSAVRLTTTNAAAGSANVGALGTNQAALLTVDIIITDFTTGKSATFYLAQSLLEKGANNATTTFTANAGGVVAGPASSGGFTLGANPTVTADTTNGGLNISYTPPAGNTDTFYAEALVRYLSIRNN